VDFPRRGIVFKDISPLLRDAQALRAAVEALAAPHQDADIDIVAGIESRGFVLGAGVALSLGAGFVPLRKQGRLPGPTTATAYRLD
jgi:adenine phosphoribosyltransferase